MQTEPIFTQPFNTGLVDMKGEPLFNGDIIQLAYLDPLGLPHEGDIEEDKYQIEFDHGAFIARKIGATYRKVVLRDFIETRLGQYIPNFGYETLFVNNVVFAVKVKGD